MDLSVNLGGIKLDNPVIPASGTFGYGLEFAELYDINILGSFSIKGTTLEPRFGNPLPRIAETPSGMLNSVGLQNPGAENVVKDVFPRLKKVYRKKVIANVGGHDEESYVRAAEILSKEDIVCAVELNISCPNVKAGGMAFGTDPDKAAAITAAVKKVCRKPLFVKLSPNVESVAANARAAEEGGADAVSLVNTFTGMAIDIERRRPVLANNTGGVSGAGIKPIAVRMVFEAAHAVKIPVVGMGGITCAEDAVEFLLAGAVAVQVGTANFTDTSACPKIIDGLDAWCDAHGVKNIGELTGALKLN